MVREKAFLKYLGNRKWRKLKKPNISLGKSFLIYLGNRKWKGKGNLVVAAEGIEPPTKAL